jgi:antibiotic biosynthesis monooxygenase (ABM) superfamily enzyme
MMSLTTKIVNRTTRISTYNSRSLSLIDAAPITATATTAKPITTIRKRWVGSCSGIPSASSVVDMKSSLSLSSSLLHRLAILHPPLKQQQQQQQQQQHLKIDKRKFLSADDGRMMDLIQHRRCQVVVVPPVMPHRRFFTNNTTASATTSKMMMSTKTDDDDKENSTAKPAVVRVVTVEVMPGCYDEFHKWKAELDTILTKLDIHGVKIEHFESKRPTNIENKKHDSNKSAMFSSKSASVAVLLGDSTDNDDNRIYDTIISTFPSTKELQIWEQSAERIEWLNRGDGKLQTLVSRTHIELPEDLLYQWMQSNPSSSSSSTIQPPTKWRMILVGVSAAYPTIITVRTSIIYAFIPPTRDMIYRFSFPVSLMLQHDTPTHDNITLIIDIFLPLFCVLRY